MVGVPTVTEKKASKKRKASAPTPVEKSVEAYTSGQEKVVSPAVKKAKTSSPTGKVKEKGKKVQFESGVVVNGVWFVSDDHAKKWEFVQKRKIVAERVLEADKYAAKEIVSLIKELDLWQSVTMAKPFAASLVREVIVNLSEGALNIGENPNWHKVAAALTGGVRSKWFTMSFPVKDLSSKHSLLHSIAVHNWMPNNHHTTHGRSLAAFLKTIGAGKKIDLGHFIFDQIAGHASFVKVNHPIGFPSLIHQLVVAQHSDILTAQDKLTGTPKVFLADHKHFSGKYILDLDLDDPVKPKKKGTERTQDELRTSVSSATRKRMITHLEEELADANERMVLLMSRKKKITKLLVSLRYPKEEDDGALEGDEASDEESDY
ncbi:hypothetical protein QQ045_014401 [Rhodiola kirilowii]